jgi:hypothetical protein
MSGSFGRQQSNIRRSDPPGWQEDRGSDREDKEDRSVFNLTVRRERRSLREERELII